MSAAPSTGRALRVLVNLTWLAPGVVGGSEESTTDSLRALLEHRADVEPTLVVRSDFAGAHPDLAAGARCEVMGVSRRSAAALTAKVRRVLAEQTWLPALTRKLRPDVTHHAGGILPLVHPGRTVLTIHDTQPLDLPGNFTLAKRHYVGAMVGRSVRSADLVCVPSEFTAGRVTELLGVARDRIAVVPWSTPRLGGNAPTGPRRGHGATGGAVTSGADRECPPVFVYPAIAYPHKNHLMLLDAFAGLLETFPDAELVLPGAAGPCDDDVRSRIVRPDLEGHVIRPGRLPAQEMERLYDRATAVVVPSSYEGFGLPALEAMVRGVPLIVSSAGSLPEVVEVGGSPTTLTAPVDPGDAGAWTAAMVSAVSLTAEQRASVVARQHLAAARFTPRLTADTLADAYHRAAGSPIT